MYVCMYIYIYISIYSVCVIAGICVVICIDVILCIGFSIAMFDHQRYEGETLCLSLRIPNFGKNCVFSARRRG